MKLLKLYLFEPSVFGPSNSTRKKLKTQTEKVGSPHDSADISGQVPAAGSGGEIFLRV